MLEQFAMAAGDKFYQTRIGKKVCDFVDAAVEYGICLMSPDNCTVKKEDLQMDFWELSTLSSSRADELLKDFIQDTKQPLTYTNVTCPTELPEAKWGSYSGAIRIATNTIKAESKMTFGEPAFN